MSAITERMRDTEFAGLVPARGSYPIKANVWIKKGSIVALDSADRAMPAGLAAGGSVKVVGKASAEYDNRTGSVMGGAAGATNVEVEFGVFGFDNYGSDEVTTTGVVYVQDDQTVAATNGSDTRIEAGFATEIRNGQVYLWMGPHVQGMIVIAASEASQLDTAQADIVNLQAEGAIGFLPIALTSWREVTTAGAVGNIAGGCGNLGSDTTPVLGAEATSESMAIIWAAANADIIQTALVLPDDFDDTADATLDLYVLTDNTGGGGVEAASFTVNTSWNNGSQVVDTATDSVPATTFHVVTATIAAADIPAGAVAVNIQLVPGTHANDPIHLLAARLTYTRVQA